MPLLKRKKVTSLPVPAPLAVLPDQAEQQRFLETVISDSSVDVQDNHRASSSSSNGPSSRRERGKLNGTSARHGHVDPFNDDDVVARTEEFEGVVLESHLGKASHPGYTASIADVKTWQPLKDSQRLFSARSSAGKDGSGMMDVEDNQEDDALLSRESPDEKLLETLLVLKQKQADILAVKRRTRSTADVPVNGKRPRSGRKADGKMEETQQDRAAGDRPNGEVAFEEATMALDDPGRYDVAKVPLQLGKWVEPEVYVIAQTGEIFETYE